MVKNYPILTYGTAAVNLIVFVYLGVYMFHIPNTILVVLLGLVLAQIWYFMASCFVRTYLSDPKNPIRFSTLGGLFALIHIGIFFTIFDLATASKAQSPLEWIYMAYVDFPLAAWFHLSLPLFGSLRLAALVVYGGLGTLFWYHVPVCIGKALQRIRRK